MKVKIALAVKCYHSETEISDRRDTVVRFSLFLRRWIATAEEQPKKSIRRSEKREREWGGMGGVLQENCPIVGMRCGRRSIGRRDQNMFS